MNGHPDSRSTYRSRADQDVIREWCTSTLAAWPVAHRGRELDTSAGTTHVTLVGGDAPSVVLVPGTSANAALYLPLLEALAARWPTMVVDLPGQPGLSGGDRVQRARLAWYGSWLREVLAVTVPGRAVVVGHSLGGAIALACYSSRIAARVLVGTAGLVRLRVDAVTLARTAAWLTRPSPASSAQLVRRFLAPGGTPPALLVEWYTLVARHCRTSLAPPVLPPRVISRGRDVPVIVASGQHDVFVPPPRLRGRVAAGLGVEVVPIPDAGHFVTHERPEAIVTLVAQASAAV